jgi:hypothetical protein
MFDDYTLPSIIRTRHIPGTGVSVNVSVLHLGSDARLQVHSEILAGIVYS